MPDDDRAPAGPTGFEALSEIGRRLLNLVGSVETTLRHGEQSRTRAFTISTMGGRLRGGAGYSARLGLDRERSDRPPPRPRPPSPEPEVDASAETLIDVFDEPNEILVTAELRGVTADEVSARVEGSELRIEVTGSRRLHKTVHLPRNVGHATPVLRVTNGIVEIRIPKPVDPVHT
jgi:HSP20 family protein